LKPDSIRKGGKLKRLQTFTLYNCLRDACSYSGYSSLWLENRDSVRPDPQRVIQEWSMSNISAYLWDG